MEITITPYKNAVTASCKWKNRRCEVTYVYADKWFVVEVKAYIKSDGHFAYTENKETILYLFRTLQIINCFSKLINTNHHNQ